MTSNDKYSYINIIHNIQRTIIVILKFKYITY
jgi:hypothetical protein